MSVMDEIRKKQDEIAQLLGAAKDEALAQAHEAVAKLKELGFHYNLVESGGGFETGNSRPAGRRFGIRDDVYNTVKQKNGMVKAEIIEAMGAKGDQKYYDSISSALSALKREGRLKQEGNVYTAV